MSLPRTTRHTTDVTHTPRTPHPAQDASAPAGALRTGLRGFAAMDPARQREIASLGGRAAHQSGHAHEFTSEEARAAGKKRHQRTRSLNT